MNSNLLRVGAMLAALAVILGAFGAHKLKELVDAAALTTWETAVRYQMYHALGILLAGIIYSQKPVNSVKSAAWFFLAGIICFSGSLYFLSLRNILPFSVLWLGPVTPIGGVLFILGWLRLVIPGKSEN